MSRLYRSMRAKLTANYAGQAMVEFAMGVTLMLIVMCACIDFGRALNDVQVMARSHSAGIGNLASRGTTLNEATAAVVQGEVRLGPGPSRQRDHYLGHQRKQRV